MAHRFLAEYGLGKNKLFEIDVNQFWEILKYENCNSYCVDSRIFDIILIGFSSREICLKNYLEVYSFSAGYDIHK
jgi:hypothetical protein